MSGQDSTASSSGGLGTVLARLSQVASVVAPTTVAASLLFYFGYVATRSRFLYFGVDLDLAGLSNQTLLLYGLEVVFPPAALAFLSILLGVGVHAAVRWLLSAPERDSTTLLVALGAGLAGLLLVGRALIGMLVPGVHDSEVPGTTALALAGGPVLLAYGAWMAGRVAAGRDAEGTGRFSRWYGSGAVRRLRTGALACVLALAVAGLFWAANQFASAYGKGRAYEDAKDLAKRPGLVVDTREQLIDLPAGIRERPLAAAAGGAPAFRYRYTGMRLLLASDGRLFCVPDAWIAGSRTLVIPYDAATRIQLIPPPAD